MKKLYRSTTDRMWLGILGGLGEYAKIDPTIVRVGFLLLLLVTGIFPFVVLYLIAYFFIPEKPPYNVVDEQ